MKIHELTPYIMTILRRDFADLSGSIKDFPYHIAIWMPHGSRNWFKIQWVLSSDDLYLEYISKRVAVELICEPTQFSGDSMLLSVTAKTTKTGEMYRQDWRSRPILIEATAHALWSVLEVNANHEILAQEILSK